jgi:hypothetical protein
MNVQLPHYLTGGEVRAGDRVNYKGVPYRVVFVSDGDNGDFLPGYSDYLGQEAGIMLRGEEDALTFLPEPDEDLELVERKEGP